VQYLNKSNWKLRVNSDVTTHTMSRPVDISLERNPALDVKTNSAVFSDRLNATKTRYYRLDINIGKLKFKDHPLYIQEDYLAAQLTQRFYEYEKRVSLCLVDHLTDRLSVLTREVQHREEEMRVSAPSTVQQSKLRALQSDLDHIRHQREDVETKLRTEKADIQKMAEELYQLWGELKGQRLTQGFTSSPVKFAVREFTEPGRETEYDFFLTGLEPTAENSEIIHLPASEITRRRSVQTSRICVRILINGAYVARTQKLFLKWPQFEVQFAERFQIHMFSRATSIQLQVCTGFRWLKTLAIVNIPPPGLNVHAMTSAALLLDEVGFQDVGMITPDWGKGERHICGLITVKSEWVGQSQKMPPIRFQDLAWLKAKEISTTESELADFLHMDANDPRNKALLDYLRRRRSIALEDLLAKDTMFPHFRFKSLRQVLLKERFRSNELVKYAIPLLEKDIRNLPVFMRFLKNLEDKIADESLVRFPHFPIHQYRLKYSENQPAIDRMKALLEKITERQNQVRLGVAKLLYSVDNVVDDFLPPDIDPFRQCLKALFAPRRPLRPKRRALETVDASSVGGATINVTIYKGVNIPVRDEAWNMRYAQVERFYQPIPPAYKGQRMNDAAAFYGTGMPPQQQPRGFFGTLFGTNQSNPQQQSQGFFGSLFGNAFGRNQQPPAGAQGPQMGNAPYGGQGPQYGGQPYGPGQPPYNGPGQPPYNGPGQPPYNGTGQPPYNGPGQFGQTAPPQYGQTGPNQFGRSSFGTGPPGGYNTAPGAFGSNRFPGQGEFGFMRAERVASFVEVRLVHNDISKVVGTTQFDGTNPEWNEMLELTFSSLSGDKFTKDELQDCTSVLYFNLFDRIVSASKVLQDYGEINVKMERRYLGSFELPLLTVFQNPGGIEAMFQIKRPIVLFGYHTSLENPFVPFQLSKNVAPPALDPLIGTYLMMKVSLEPVLELPTEADAEYYPGFENPRFLFQGAHSLAELKRKKIHKNRYIRIFAENFEGQSVFLPRFITALAPPASFNIDLTTDKAINQVTRFVSLIPFVEDNQAFKDLPDVWCGCQQFLDLCAGDYEEHSILLCNYFKFIDQNRPERKTYLALGKGIPEGNTIYVCRRELQTGEVELWNGSTGQGFSFSQRKYGSNFICCPIFRGSRTVSNQQDYYCPLQSIGCLVDEEDIYINIQDVSDPNSIDFDVTNVKKWQPFLGKGPRRDAFFLKDKTITSIQQPLFYEETPVRYAQDMQLQIEDYVRRHFEEARRSGLDRRPMRTRWNFQLADAVRPILNEMELFYFNTRKTANLSAMNKGHEQDVLLQLHGIQDVSPT